MFIYLFNCLFVYFDEGFFFYFPLFLSIFFYFPLFLSIFFYFPLFSPVIAGCFVVIARHEATCSCNDDEAIYTFH